MGDDVGKKAQSDVTKRRDARQRRVAVVQRAANDMRTAFAGLSDDAPNVAEAKALIDRAVAIAIVAVSQH
jgi:hypothetical protein